MADETVLTARELYRFYRAGEEETLALRGVSLRVRRGETITLLCSRACEDETHCHRSLLRGLIEGAVGP